MPGIADLLYLGQPNPAQQIAQALSGQQPQQPGQPGAAPPAGAPAAANGAAPNPAPGAPPPPGSPPQPTAYASSPDMQASYQTLANPPSLMSLYLALDQRQRASDQINKGFALIAANHAGNPAMMRNIMDSVGGSSGDAGSTVNNLLGLYQGQQQMQATQQLLAQAPDIAAKLNLPLDVVRARIIAGGGADLVKAMEPTEQQRNIQAEHDAFIKGGGSEEDWQKNYLPMIITGGIPGMTPDMKSMNVARTQWLADPANKDRPMPSYLTDATKWGIYSKDLGDAKGSFNGMNQALTKFADDAGDIAADPELANITGSPVNALKARNALSGTAAYDLTGKMKQLGADAKAMATRGGPKGVGQNLATLGANPDAFTDYGVSHYGEDQIAPKIRTALEARANAYGAAGQLAQMPHYLDPYLDPMYKPGGDLDPGGGTKPFTLSKDPNLKQPTPADLETFKHNLEHFGPKRALAQLKADNIDTSSLE